MNKEESLERHGTTIETPQNTYRGTSMQPSLAARHRRRRRRRICSLRSARPRRGLLPLMGMALSSAAAGRAKHPWWGGALGADDIAPGGDRYLPETDLCWPSTYYPIDAVAAPGPAHQAAGSGNISSTGRPWGTGPFMLSDARRRRRRRLFWWSPGIRAAPPDACGGP